MTVVRGSLEDDAALRELVAGAAAVVHCAGAVAAPSADGVLRRSTRRARPGWSPPRRPRRDAAALPPAVVAGRARARRVSPYARSKREAEDDVRRVRRPSGIEVCILRPPAVYGPGDRATLPIFRQLRDGLLFVPAVSDARFSLLYVGDLADADRAAARGPALGRRARSSSTTAGRAATAGAIWPRSPAGSSAGRCAPSPLPLVAAVAGGGRRWRSAARRCGRAPRLSPGKLRELFHADWVARPPQSRLARLGAAHDLRGGLRADHGMVSAAAVGSDAGSARVR